MAPMSKMKLDDLKSYIGIQFVIDGSNDCIPKKWISKWGSTLKMVKWPSHAVSTKAKTAEDAEDSWIEYEFVPLCHATTYERCIKKLYSTVELDSSSAEVFAGQEDTINISNLSQVHFSEACNEPSTSTNDKDRSNANHLESCCKCSDTLNEMSLRVEETCQKNELLLTLLKSVDKKVACLLMRLNEKESQEKQEGPVFLPPAAETLEELKLLAEHVCLKPTLEKISGARTMESTRMLIKRVFSPSLATTFSLTGLGEKRLKSKNSFKDHPIATPIVDSVLKKHECTRAEILACARDVLKGARDWEGGRKQRLTTATSSTSTTSSFSA